MNDIEKTYRLFIGADILAKWPEVFVSGDIIKEENRHLTLCFLGDRKQAVKEELLSFPKPTDVLSPVGIFEKYKGLPKKNARLIAVEGKLIHGMDLENYRNIIISWLLKNKIELKEDKRAFYPHLAICRKNFKVDEWESERVKIPFYLKGIHLYQSLGNSEYKKLKSYLFNPVFEQIEHTADMAFLIRGNTLQGLYINAQIALSFVFSDFSEFLDLDTKIKTKDQIIMALNTIVSKVDIEVGCPIKAVSFHGAFKELNLGYFEWDMIIDV